MAAVVIGIVVLLVLSGTLVGVAELIEVAAVFVDVTVLSVLDIEL